MKAKKKLPFFDKFILFINALLCLLLLISYLAPVVDPKKIWFIAFFGLAYPLLLTANVVLMVYWLLRRKWLFLVSLVCILVGFNVLKDNIGFRFGGGDGPPLQQKNAIRLLTYNVHEFKKYNSHNDTSTKHEILQIIKEQQPDVIGFQEFLSRKKGPFDLIDSIKPIMKSNYYYFMPFSRNAYRSRGMAIFSKLPIVAKGTILLSDTSSENQCLYVDVKKDNSIFRLYTVHLQSIKFDDKDYTSLDSVSSKGKTDMHSIKRMVKKLIKAFAIRGEQVRKLKDSAAKCPYPYIISGDFNDTPTSYAVSQMCKGLKNAFREKGSGFGRTYNGDFPNYQIDYVMVSPQFDVANYHIIERKLSDHYPVRSDLILKEN